MVRNVLLTVILTMVVFGLWSCSSYTDSGDVITNSIVMKLVHIPAGEFMMGSNDGDSDEKPVHLVRISEGFYMGVTEVTQAQYREVMGINPSCFKGDNLPVENVNWNDVMEFCKKLSQKEGKDYRLPTEAQWEYACRAGTKTRFGFGDSESSLGDYAWYEGSGGSKTHSVGVKKPNAWGMYDMHGNVWEWCSDWYSSDYYKTSPSANPIGPASGRLHVLRGGYWGNVPGSCRSAYRNGHKSDYRYCSQGFRVVVSVSSQTD